MIMKYLFYEDGRKRRSPALFGLIVAYPGFLAFLIVGILGILGYVSIFEVQQSKTLIALSIFMLFCGIQLNWFYISKYSKYYIFITETEIEFFTGNGEPHNYNLSDLRSYEVIDKASVLEGGRMTIKLNFVDDKYYIISTIRKAKKFKEVLDKIIEKQNIAEV